MLATIPLLTLSLAVAQPADRGEWVLAPQYVPGLELKYLGTYRERSLIPGVEHRRDYVLRNMILISETKATGWEAAIMTGLGLRDLRQSGGDSGPMFSRLESAEVDKHGSLLGRNRHGLVLPLDGPPTVETGSFVPFPLGRVGKLQEWTVNEAGRPPRTWQVIGVESKNGSPCLKLVGTQQSSDWASPRADSMAWSRLDVVWILPNVGIPCRVERTIKLRDKARDVPTHVTEAVYDLEDYRVQSGTDLADRQFEILWAGKFRDDARPLAQQPGIYRAQLERLAHKINFHLNQYAETPYRQAVLQVKQDIDRACRGEAAKPGPEQFPELVPTVKIGQTAPDFSASELTGTGTVQLHRMLGQPVLLFFYNPETDTGRRVLEFVRRLNEKQRDKLTVVAMAVSDDVDCVCRQKKEMGLAFPIYCGTGMRLTFGVDATPRFVVLDADGIVRGAFTGWAEHVVEEIEALLQGLTQR
jgi:peroxiredoxin